MPCYKPLSGFYSEIFNPSGKRSIVFDVRKANVTMPVQVPCGQCIGCRLERSRQWAVRCVHEASLYADNCFITLTFRDEFIPVNSSLVKRDFVLFMKRLRKRYGSKIRFFHCGEYGERLKRPHHHACIFNFDFPDKVLWTERSGVRLYRSASLEQLWPYGFCTVGAVNFESAAYVARYVTKKITGDMADKHYGDRVPEYVTMSRRPGIAYDWFVKYKTDVYPSDFVVIRGGIKCKPPRYYDNKYDLTDPSECGMLKIIRQRKALASPDNRPYRLNARRRVQEANFQKLKRGFENGVESV
ncbi:MAG: replication initiator protein [Arizlama microvirus]|nr:MAG: replication initiator protein [Arizlama microvirus]